MSHLLSQWLHDNQVAIAEDQLDAAFKNGYLLGEMLRRRQLLDDTLINAPHAHVAIQNFVSIEKALYEKLGLSISPSLALDVMNGVPGAAAKLLYLVKCSLDSASKSLRDRNE
jgi:hypothetical protein